MTNVILVDRLWALYAWPEWKLPMKGMTVDRLQSYQVQAEYINDRPEGVSPWDYGRIRFFYNELLAGRELDPIEIDNVCDGGRIYPIPVLNDGHHRLASSHLASARVIRANYGGRVDLLRYLTGRRKTCPGD